MRCPPGQLVREAAPPADSHFTSRVGSELKAAGQINPNGFSPAFTLSGVSLTGVMLINEKCFAPLHRSTNAECKKVLPFFFLRRGKREKIADGKAIGSRRPANLFAYGLHGGLPGGGATHTALGQVPACRLPSLHCEGLPAWIFHFPGISEPLRPTGQAGKLSYATSSSHYR